MAQYRIILNTCPDEDVFDIETVETPLMEPNFIFKYSDDWSKASHAINDILSTVKKLNTYLMKCKGRAPCTEFDLIVPQFIPIADLSIIKSDVSNIQLNIKNLDDVLHQNVSTKSLAWLGAETEKILAQLDENLGENLVSIDVSTKKIEELTENILVVIQNLYKKYNTVTKTVDLTEETQEQLQDEHLKKMLIENLSNDMMILDMKKILNKTHNISRVLLKIPPNLLNRKDVVSQCVPFLEQIIHLYEYFITQQVSAYRVTCKMTSILLNIFIDLVSKVSYL